MYYIFKYYTTREETWLQSLFWNGKGEGTKSIDDCVKSCIQWLTVFTNWEDFVERNYLQDFVKDWDNRNLYPKEFWDGHFQCKMKPDFNQFFETATECIKNRGDRIQKALAKKEKSQ